MPTRKATAPLLPITAYRIKTDITFSPTNVRGKKLSKVDLIVNPMPHKLDVFGESFLGNEFGQIIFLTFDRVRRQSSPFRFEDRIRMKQEDFLIHVAFGNGPEIIRFIINESKNAIARWLFRNGGSDGP